jgi:hypothetical protein
MRYKLLSRSVITICQQDRNDATSWFSNLGYNLSSTQTIHRLFIGSWAWLDFTLRKRCTVDSFNDPSNMNLNGGRINRTVDAMHIQLFTSTLLKYRMTVTRPACFQFNVCVMYPSNLLVCLHKNSPADCFITSLVSECGEEQMKTYATRSEPNKLALVCAVYIDSKPEIQWSSSESAKLDWGVRIQVSVWV